MERDFTLQATFWSTPETAERLREVLQDAAACLLHPTDEAASRTFHLAGEAIYHVAQQKRESGVDVVSESV